MSTGRKCTAEEDDHLLELKAAGKSLSVIAEELNRSQASIDNRTNRLKEMKAPLGLRRGGK
jgi:DNA-binding NarL/FixJ family response regulator